ncbi:PLC-like phosphodiesterase [Sistotremastrum suecicum HHB10207 ss-3]|uniref:PLC-like phosphodiesterase n=1 Tax=Sistotremastrum suecicum HHB10207 ss-3 TaxID=1314776 RepID=A0A166BNT7_9AGAM|nr:PLC-like phosphodiesterase [Sistotremastrum suecicum HHB10207 ss-3]
MLFSSLSAQAALLSLFAVTSPYVSATPLKRASVCNGYSELCSRSFGNVTFVGAHDSYAVGATNLAANQDYNVTQQLTDGIRMLQNQAHSASDGSIHLCHTDCLLYDAGTLQDYLTSVKSWMDANPNEVVSILLVNINNLAASSFGSVFQSTGLVPMSYVPTSTPMTTSQWPSLGSMIDAGTRLVTFMDNGANDTNFPFLIPEFGNIWETAFDVTDPSFSCAINRSQGDTSQQMYLINHFLDATTDIAGFGVPAPAKDQLNVTNAQSGPGSLGQQAADCIAQYSAPPNFMLVDFYEYGQGSVFDVAANLNGVAAPTNSIAPPIINATSSSSSSGSSSGALTDFRGSGRVTGLALFTGFLVGIWTVS